MEHTQAEDIKNRYFALPRGKTMGEIITEMREQMQARKEMLDNWERSRTEDGYPIDLPG